MYNGRLKSINVQIYNQHISRQQAYVFIHLSTSLMTNDRVLSSEIMTKICAALPKGPPKLPTKNVGLQRSQWPSNNSRILATQLSNKRFLVSLLQVQIISLTLKEWQIYIYIHELLSPQKKRLCHFLNPKFSNFIVSNAWQHINFQEKFLLNSTYVLEIGRRTNIFSKHYALKKTF